jgi:hypothetical protein
MLKGEGGGKCLQHGQWRRTFTLRVKPTGGKLCRWSCRFECKEKLMPLGKYPDVLLALARERHAEARELLAAETDPMAQRKAEKTADTLPSEIPSRAWPHSGWRICSIIQMPFPYFFYIASSSKWAVLCWRRGYS